MGATDDLTRQFSRMADKSLGNVSKYASIACLISAKEVSRFVPMFAVKIHSSGNPAGYCGLEKASTTRSIYI